MTGDPRAPVPVALVSMPFPPLELPSLGLSLLQAGLGRVGIGSRIHYFTLAFAERIGVGLYERISCGGHGTADNLLGEWMFSGALAGRPPDPEAFLAELLREWWERRLDAPPASLDLAPAAAARLGEVEPFLDECAARLVAARPRVVGFSSVFQQHAASLALARRVKRELPEAVVVLGGANCEGPMGAETLASFEFVDVVVSGEADGVFPALVERLLAGRSPAGLPGVLTRGDPEPAPPAPVRVLDELPVPAFDDYFDALAASAVRGEVRPEVLVETSRGCWWGERSTCTFCGLNGGSAIAYRSKSAGRALAELAGLAARHPGVPVQATDNILAMRYFDELLPALAERELGLDLFFEVKSNLSREHVRRLHAAGIRRIQPGIESLSSPVLELMRKGVRAIQNVALLKWCRELGVEPLWNVLWGFPGETSRDYERQAALMPLLHHLPPPLGGFAIRLERFSPSFDRADELGFAGVEPAPAYRAVYDLEPERIGNLAYYFVHATPASADVRPVADAIRDWQRAHATSTLTASDDGRRLRIRRTRDGETAEWELRGLARRLYLACEAPAPLARLRERAAADAPAGRVEEALAPLLAEGLAMREDASYLALAVRA